MQVEFERGKDIACKLLDLIDEELEQNPSSASLESLTQALVRILNNTGNSNQ